MFTWLTRRANRCPRCGRYAARSHTCQPAATPTVRTQVPVRSAKQAARDEITERWERFAASHHANTSAGRPDDATRLRIPMWDHRPGHRGQRITVDLDATLTPDMIAIFEHGHCHSLALALAETGHNVYAVIPTATEPQFYDVKARHYVAVHPSNPSVAIDIHGSQPLEAVTARYPGTALVRLDDPAASIAAAVRADGMLPVSLPAGRHAAELVRGH